MVYLALPEEAEAEVVLFVGSGAVTDAWEPIHDALDAHLPERSANCANTYLATLVHRLRWLHRMTNLSRSTRTALSAQADAEYKAEYQRALSEYREVTNAMCVALQQHREQLRIRANGVQVKRCLLDRFNYESSYPTFHIVTTNWDFSALEFQDHGMSNIPSIDYLHGTCEVGLYLPGEILNEPYRDSDNVGEFTTSMFGVAHTLRDARRMVVYGLSFSPLDAELGFLVQAVSGRRAAPFEDVIVVDPNPAPVIARLQTLMGAQNFIGMLPTEIKEHRSVRRRSWPSPTD